MTAKLEKKQQIIISLNVLFFLFIFFYPNNGTYYFDGLPFTNTLETLLFTIFFPLSLFFNFIFKSRKILFLLTIIFIFKIFLIDAPKVGVDVKQYFTPKQKIENNYIKTFDSFWNKDISILQKFPWKKLSHDKIGLWPKKKKIKFKNILTKNEIHKFFFKNIYQIGYRYFKVKQRDKKDKLIVKAFQRRYNPKKIDGKIDLKVLKISHLLAKSSH